MGICFRLREQDSRAAKWRKRCNCQETIEFIDEIESEEEEKNIYFIVINDLALLATAEKV